MDELPCVIGITLSVEHEQRLLPSSCENQCQQRRLPNEPNKTSIVSEGRTPFQFWNETVEKIIFTDATWAGLPDYPLLSNPVLKILVDVYQLCLFPC